MAVVSLVPVDKENWVAVTKLKLAEGQENWVAPNWYSIIEALMEGYESRAIVADGEIVGYAMCCFNTAERMLYVVRLMVAMDKQGKGYGRAALEQILNEGRAHPEIDTSHISFVPGNDGAKRLYERLGYVDTGRVEDDEHIYEADLRTSKLS